MCTPVASGVTRIYNNGVVVTERVLIRQLQ